MHQAISQQSRRRWRRYKDKMKATHLFAHTLVNMHVGIPSNHETLMMNCVMMDITVMWPLLRLAFLFVYLVVFLRDSTHNEYCVSFSIIVFWIQIKPQVGIALFSLGQNDHYDTVVIVRWTPTAVATDFHCWKLCLYPLMNAQEWFSTTGPRTGTRPCTIGHWAAEIEKLRQKIIIQIEHIWLLWK